MDRRQQRPEALRRMRPLAIGPVRPRGECWRAEALSDQYQDHSSQPRSFRRWGACASTIGLLQTLVLATGAGGAATLARRCASRLAVFLRSGLAKPVVRVGCLLARAVLELAFGLTAPVPLSRRTAGHQSEHPSGGYEQDSSHGHSFH